MSIEIKAIECPKCGSTQKTQLRENDFRCESCGTEYFLDNGNTQKGAKKGIVDPRRQPAPSVRGCSGLALLILIGLVVVFCVLAALIRGGGNSPGGSKSAGSEPGHQPPTWQYTSSFVYLSPDKRPIIVAIGNLTIHKPTGEQREPYIFFFDALRDSLIKRFQIPGRDEINNSDVWSFQHLSNGDLYVNDEREFLFKIDKSSYSIKDVTTTFGADQPELASGLANVQLSPGSIGDGFRVVTNNGKELYYFPLVHKVYKQPELYEAESGMNTILPSAKPATGFCFVTRRTEDGDDTDRLTKFRYMDNGGGPKKDESPGWQANGKPESIQPRYDRLLSLENFTPGRLYFEPRVLYSDSEYVLISYAPTAARKGRVVQCLDARTAAIVFTSKLEETYLEAGSIRYKGGFAVRYLNVYLIDMQGHVKKLKNGNYYGS